MKVSLICHRKPERTFNIKGHYFPVCSRCTGIHIGAIFYYLLVYFLYIDYNIYLISMASLMAIPTFIDGFTQLLGYRESNNTLRFFTGLLAGIGLGLLIKSFKTIFL